MIAMFASLSTRTLDNAIQTLRQTNGTKMCPLSTNGGAKMDVRGLQLATLLALRRSLASLAPLPVHPERNPALWAVPQLR